MKKAIIVNNLWDGGLDAVDLDTLEVVGSEHSEAELLRQLAEDEYSLGDAHEFYDVDSEERIIVPGKISLEEAMKAATEKAGRRVKKHDLVRFHQSRSIEIAKSADGQVAYA